MATRDDLLNKLGRGQAAKRVAVGEQIQPVATQPVAPQPGVGQAEARVQQAAPQTPQQVVQPTGSVAQTPSAAPVANVPTATPSVTPSVTPSPVAQTAPQTKVTKSYTELIESLNKRKDEYQPLSPEDLEKERKRRKREAVFSALGDGLSSLANLYFTSRGAENVYDPNNALTRVAQKRWSEDRKQRETEEDKYLQLQKVLADLEMGRLDRDKADAIRQQERADREKEAAQRQANWQAEMQYRKEKDAAEAKARKEQQQFQSEEAAKGRAHDTAMQGERLKYDADKTAKQNEADIKKATLNVRGSGKDRFTGDELAYLYGLIPKEEKSKVGEPIRNMAGKIVDRGEPSKSDMESLVIRYASTNPEYLNTYTKVLYGGIPSGAPKGKPGWSPDPRAKHQAPVKSE